jgi:hypothetical protein
MRLNIRGVWSGLSASILLLASTAQAGSLETNLGGQFQKGRDAEMRFMPNGDPVTAFSVAVDRSYKIDGENIKRTFWYKVSVFGKFAEVCKGLLPLVV